LQARAAKADARRDNNEDTALEHGEPDRLAILDHNMEDQLVFAEAGTASASSSNQRSVCSRCSTAFADHPGHPVQLHLGTNQPPAAIVGAQQDVQNTVTMFGNKSDDQLVYPVSPLLLQKHMLGADGKRRSLNNISEEFSGKTYSLVGELSAHETFPSAVQYPKCCGAFCDSMKTTAPEIFAMYEELQAALLTAIGQMGAKARTVALSDPLLVFEVFHHGIDTPEVVTRYYFGMYFAADRSGKDDAYQVLTQFELVENRLTCGADALPFAGLVLQVCLDEFVPPKRKVRPSLIAYQVKLG